MVSARILSETIRDCSERVVMWVDRGGLSVVKNHTFRFRITKAQYERIKNEAQAKGYVTVAPYLRDLALQRSGFIETKIVETHDMIKKLLEELPWKKK